MEIFSLVGRIMVDSSEANQSISKTSDNAEGLGSKLASGAKTAAKWGAGLVTAAAGAGAAMVKASKETAANLDVVDKGSQRMGISAEKYQELAYAAGLSGVEMSTMEKAAKQLQKTGSDMTLDEAIAQIQAIDDETERTNAAFDLFGTAAYNMGPLLDAGAGSMEAMADEAHNLGLVFDQDTVSSGAAMNDMFSKVEQSCGTLLTELMTELMPYVMEILQWVIDEMPKIKQSIRKFIEWITPFVKPILDGIIALVDGLFDLIDGDIDGFFEGLWEFLGGLGESFLKIGEQIIEWILKGLKAAWEKVKEWVRNAVEWFKTNFSDIIDDATGKNWGTGTNRGGSMHAGGLPYVPYDGYQATLHRGESVMTAADSQSLLQAVKSIAEGGGNGGTINITVQSVLDGRVIGESVTAYQRNRARAYG